ncbi:DinB family protein [Denitrobaculum tricleocarpae]|uniref:Damage-inducible protein DinB n=1 Tax=Denitrobaculum tricleocarpae TaxID=2591009 RepID=A0A545TKH5_9PROT|nr:DinB family protein [Denitrobaculum tricleocarpae]TQV77686.1 damage-inducible protein DinB [Denitrobaculum tricleocarpae]
MNTAVTKPDKISNPLQMLTRYKAWANRLTYEKVAELPPEELTRERQTNFKTILHTLNHVYVVDDIFRAHLEGRSHGYKARNTETSPPLETLWSNVQAMDRWYIDLADRLSDAELAEVITFEFVGGGAGAMSRMEILHHLVNHATYHRGFVSDMLYQVPLRPTANDLPVFLRDVWNSA